MYSLSLNKNQMSTYATGLTSSAKIIAQSILNAPNTALALRQFLPELLNINHELTSLDRLIDTTDKIEASKKAIENRVANKIVNGESPKEVENKVVDKIINGEDQKSAGEQNEQRPV